MRSVFSCPARLVAGLVFLAFAAPSQAAPAAADVFGNWSRTPAGCKRPEFQLRATDVALQTDGDGSSQAFSFRKVAWATDAQGLVTVDLGEPHPYGKAPSKTALAFRVVGADDIELVQRTHPVPLHRCPAH